MARSPIYPLRLDDATKARWEAAAKAELESLAEYVRTAVEQRITDANPRVGVKPSRPPADPSNRGGKARPRAERAEMCEHRRPAGTYCPRCGA